MNGSRKLGLGSSHSFSYLQHYSYSDPLLEKISGGGDGKDLVEDIVVVVATA